MSNKDIIAIVLVYVALMGLMFVVLGSGIAHADTIYWEYVDCDGVVTYTDRDPVPAYRDEAILVTTDGLENYRYYTRDDSPFVPAAQTPSTPKTSSDVAPAASPSRVIVDINRYHPKELYRP